MDDPAQSLNRDSADEERAVRGRGLILVIVGVIVLAIVGSIAYTVVGDRADGIPEASSESRGAQGSHTRPIQGGREETAMDPGRSRNDLSSLVASEELLLDLTKDLKHLKKSALNLALPDAGSRHHFADYVEVLGLDTIAHLRSKDALPHLDLEEFSWPLAEQLRRVAGNRVNLWRDFFANVRFFDYAEFYFVRGRFVDERRTVWQADVNFEALARLESERYGAIKASQEVQFQRSDSAKGAVWRIVRWTQKSFVVTERSNLLFSDVLADALPDPDVRKRASHSIHESYVRASAFDPEFKWPIDVFSPVSVDRHPGLSVVDVDRDGFDDLYVMARWGKNLLLRNRGNGTFEENAAQFGLDIEGHCSSAIFADFDNDGDADVILGRTLEPSLYLRNDNGTYVDCSKSHVTVPLPKLVSSIAAADYNGDGLLDVLISTYAADLWQRQWMSFEALEKSPKGTRPKLDKKMFREYEEKTYLADYLPVEQARELYKRSRSGHVITARPGPPNLLLVNRGRGRFDVSKENEKVEVWFNTYQSTWCDTDGDGDPDLYVANDFAPNRFFRNDAGVLVDVTDPVTADIGFGMGASFGDFDNDLKQDLYVSNMYSKAGRRIAAQLPDLDPRIAAMARGNSLLHNREAGFEKISGTTADTFQVEVAGWAWGGQFLDVDNDSYLDIYALSGNYTPPRQVETIVDV